MRAPYGMELIEDCKTCPLRKNGFFCQLPAPALQAFSNVKFTTTYPAQAVLYVEGQAPRGIYMLCKGRVKLTMNSADGKTLIVRICEPGEILGAQAAISGEPYEVTAEALQPCQVDFVRREDFVKLLHDQPEIAAAAMRQLSNGYRRACQEIRYLGLSRSASEKVAQFLLETSSSGQQTSVGKRFHLGLTHEEISQIVGISRETVTRTMTEFKSKALIATKGTMVVIRNESGLRAQAAAA
ncbi:MAG TPA: Crp/Fnr family transcriptional regulator [Candidatus Acidoferrales bacterium]|nr:Crp/Fnr family transcriptional regulator [Candidatus Acidoferrales bacterium]